MKILFTKIILLLLFLSVACSKDEKLKSSVTTNTKEIDNLTITQIENPKIPEQWKKIEACGLSFYAPPTFEEIKIQPIDSCAKDYRNKDIFISLDLIQGIGVKESDTRKNEYLEKKEFQIAQVKIDNRSAEIITYFGKSDFPELRNLLYGAVLFVPVIAENRDNLTIWTYSRSVEDREIAKKIFETIKFEK